MISDLDKIGLEAASVLSEAWTAAAQARGRPLVEEIFAAFEEAKKNKVKIVINGAKGKTQWGGGVRQGQPALLPANQARRHAQERGQKHAVARQDRQPRTRRIS